MARYESKQPEGETNPRGAAGSPYYLDADGPGYVTLVGSARLVDEPAQKARHWKESWTPFYPDRDESVVLIQVTPLWLEIVSVPHGANGDPEDWRADIVEFVAGTSGR